MMVNTPEGRRMYYAYDDNREIASDYGTGVITAGAEVLYRGAPCYVVSDFTDEDGERYVEMVLLIDI